MWFQNRRAKWKKRKKTGSGSGGSAGAGSFRSASNSGLMASHNLTTFTSANGQQQQQQQQQQTDLFGIVHGDPASRCWPGQQNGGGGGQLHGGLTGFSPSLSQLNQLSNALTNHHHHLHHTHVAAGAGIMSPSGGGGHHQPTAGLYQTSYGSPTGNSFLFFVISCLFAIPPLGGRCCHSMNL